MAKLKKGTKVRMDTQGGGKKPKVVKVCIPFYESLPSPAILHNEHLIKIGLPGYLVDIDKRESTIIQFARNEMTEQTRTDYPYDFVFFIDSDMGFSNIVMNTPTPSGFPIMIDYMNTILSHDKPICGGIYPRRKPPHEPNVLRHIVGDTYQTILNPPETGLHPVGALGTGFMCIKREVFEKMGQYLLETEKKVKASDKALEKIRSKIKALENSLERTSVMKQLRLLNKGYEVMDPFYHPPFWLKYTKDPFDKKWKFMGEDIFFCHFARELGYKIYADFSVDVGHQSVYYPDVSKYRAAYMEDCIKTYNKKAKLVGLPSNEDAHSFEELYKP